MEDDGLRDNVLHNVQNQDKMEGDEVECGIASDLLCQSTASSIQGPNGFAAGSDHAGHIALVSSKGDARAFLEGLASPERVRDPPVRDVVGPTTKHPRLCALMADQATDVGSVSVFHVPDVPGSKLAQSARGASEDTVLAPASIGHGLLTKPYTDMRGHTGYLLFCVKHVN